jgi:hypothetical protein
LLGNAQNFFAEQAENTNVDSKMKSGFNNLLECLDLYMDQEIIVDESKVTIYGSVIIENGAIIRATNSYYDRPWFSNVSIRMDSDELFNYTSDQGICYGQVPLIM